MPTHLLLLLTTHYILLLIITRPHIACVAGPHCGDTPDGHARPQVGQGRERKALHVAQAVRLLQRADVSAGDRVNNHLVRDFSRLREM
jgi:hypothetical protein